MLLCTPPSSVKIGGLRKSELLSLLHHSGVLLNELAVQLFEDERFSTLPTSRDIEIIHRSVAELGFPDGAVWDELTKRAAAQGYYSCPLELGPHLRLHLTNQGEGSTGQPKSENRAPPGSLTVVSEALSPNDEFPKGFYLRRIDGTLWLRGYRSWAGHVWEPANCLVFSRTSNAA